VSRLAQPVSQDFQKPNIVSLTCRTGNGRFSALISIANTDLRIAFQSLAWCGRLRLCHNLYSLLDTSMNTMVVDY